MKQQENPQNVIFKALDTIPGQLWYILGIASIVTSLVCQLAGKKNWADFVGKWPPTFFAIGLYHKLVRPGQEDAAEKLRQAGYQIKEAAHNGNN